MCTCAYAAQTWRDNLLSMERGENFFMWKIDFYSEMQ